MPDKKTIAHKSICPRCGEVHRFAREKRECRKSKGERSEIRQTTNEERHDSPSGIYERDPLRGDKRAHAILKLHRGGLPDRKIAKVIGWPLSDVRAVIEKAGR